MVFFYAGLIKKGTMPPPSSGGEAALPLLSASYEEGTALPFRLE